MTTVTEAFKDDPMVAKEFAEEACVKDLEAFHITAMNKASNERVFAGIYPCGIVYADRNRTVGGDYKRLAFLPFGSLKLEVNDDCPSDLHCFIAGRAAEIQAKKGQSFKISACGQSVILGGAA